jgi:ABC-type antimicrobial peptide transport system permease subunit
MVFGPSLEQFLGGVPVGSLSLWSALVGMAVAICTGLIAGLLPATRARQSSVIEAIRR